MAQLHPHHSKSASQLQAPGGWYHVLLSYVKKPQTSLYLWALTKLVCSVCQQLSAAPNIPAKGVKCCSGIWLSKHLFFSVVFTDNRHYLHLTFAGPEGSVVLIDPDWRHCTGHGQALMFCISFSSQPLCWHRLTMCNYLVWLMWSKKSLARRYLYLYLKIHQWKRKANLVPSSPAFFSARVLPNSQRSCFPRLLRK